ncbi:hypothetical protein [Paenibacillus kobensis]|uniref:hypothetical protein n=1 Tax=Paenibacillus kobensis TaxID=59841 RepID=UPI000FDA301F|nr:hypothetical protein [Paenibacillus kobensis]
MKKNNRTLVICDVQQQFANGYSLEYIEEIKKYIQKTRKTWERIIVIVDVENSAAHIPDWMEAIADVVVQKISCNINYIYSRDDYENYEVIENGWVWKTPSESVVHKLRDNRAIELIGDMVSEFKN